MMRAPALWAAVALLAACERVDAPETPSSPAAPAKSAPGTPASSAPATLVGEWRVAGVGGKPINLPHGISASISANRIKVSSQCVVMEWSYRFEGRRLVTEPIPIVACDRGRYPEELAIEAALDAAGTVSRTPENGVEITGGGGSLLLFSQ